MEQLPSNAQESIPPRANFQADFSTTWRVVLDIVSKVSICRKVSKLRYIEYRSFDVSKYRSFDVSKYRSFDTSKYRECFALHPLASPCFCMQMLNESFDVYIKYPHRTCRLDFLLIDIVSNSILVRYPTLVESESGSKRRATRLRTDLDEISPRPPFWLGALSPPPGLGENPPWVLGENRF